MLERNLRHVKLVRLEELEIFDPQLKKCESSRSRVEYFFTMSPCLPLYVLATGENIGSITYLDADLYFFDSFEKVFEEIGDANIAIIPHNYTEGMLKKGAVKNGVYNVGWITWKYNDEGLKCLNEWREKCIEWCYDKHEDDRFADQKYLDTWPSTFDGVKIITHPGANLAPWNAGNYHLEIVSEAVVVDTQALLFYHFHGLKQLNMREFDCHLSTYFVGTNKNVLINALYIPYINRLIEISDVPITSIRGQQVGLIGLFKKHLKLFLKRRQGDIIHVDSPIP
ncbi:hypothetical protein PQO03_09550 [Lentisphaera profundi]|uniref:Glycosyl transferase n=1 Tax=Lentisphaera profundi TaxID=1658616 RepID=A0ABY7VPN9_9BACT|nr:hypothetical protein [Lentisphaera profundi]WDE95957.1 hypothetical protein PQO03_09550 [Lentisphaera profundi]